MALLASMSHPVLLVSRTFPPRYFLLSVPTPLDWPWRSSKIHRLRLQTPHTHLVFWQVE